MSYHSCDFVRHEQILVGQCPKTDCYLQPCNTAKNINKHPITVRFDKTPSLQYSSLSMYGKCSLCS